MRKLLVNLPYLLTPAGKRLTENDMVDKRNQVEGNIGRIWVHGFQLFNYTGGKWVPFGWTWEELLKQQILI